MWIIGVVVIVLIILCFGLPFVLTRTVYEDTFGRRYESQGMMALSVDDFEGLNREQKTFFSDKGQQLVGYTYTKGNDEKKGLIVVVHGFGDGGHSGYMDVINYFADQGYYVFSYDATGNDESEGAAGALLADNGCCDCFLYFCFNFFLAELGY